MITVEEFLMAVKVLRAEGREIQRTIQEECERHGRTITQEEREAVSLLYEEIKVNQRTLDSFYRGNLKLA